MFTPKEFKNYIKINKVVFNENTVNLVLNRLEDALKNKEYEEEWGLYTIKYSIPTTQEDRNEITSRLEKLKWEQVKVYEKHVSIFMPWN